MFLKAFFPTWWPRFGYQMSFYQALKSTGQLSILLISLLFFSCAYAQEVPTVLPTTPTAAPNKSQIMALLKEPMAGAGPKNMLETVGSVSWKLTAQDNPEGPFIAGTITYPEAHFEVSLLIKKNFNPKLAASHVILLNFKNSGGTPPRIVKDFAGIELRTTHSSQGNYLKGLSIPMGEASFAVALFKTDYDTRFNVELLEKLEWFTFPVRFENNRNGFLFFSKGEDGVSVFQKAFSIWNQNQN